MKRQRPGRSDGDNTGRKKFSPRGDGGRRKPKAAREDRFSSRKIPARDDVLAGRNPVIEALRHGRTIEKIFIAEGSEGSVSVVKSLARERGVVTETVPRRRIDDLAPGQNHQGVAAIVSEYRYAELSDILDRASASGEDPFLIILDGIEDPHNLGAIIRTAECAGAHGVIIPKRNSCGLTCTVAKASAGAIETIPVARVTNIARTIENLKRKGIWVAASDMDGEDCFSAPLDGPVAIVIGSEGRGVSRLVREKCDFIVSIPMKGEINSLNASNAAAVLMYEIRRRRG